MVQVQRRLPISYLGYWKECSSLLDNLSFFGPVCKCEYFYSCIIIMVTKDHVELKNKYLRQMCTYAVIQ